MVATGAVTKLAEVDFESVLKEDKLVVCDFYATWCGPCKAFAPKFEEMAKAHTNVIFVKVDADECEELSKKYEVTALPTLVAFKGGAEVGRVVGASEDQVKELVKTFM
ncbi:unnamed protein product [Mesocestoides corti]|uniref:Thioredoxin n=1 Tax=Mesocestoides corti TaxID=53468 RepID=A0A0R3ULX8_MESCO|nr:unnamed protein product [Mesocestoides corti]